MRTRCGWLALTIVFTGCGFEPKQAEKRRLEPERLTRAAEAYWSNRMAITRWISTDGDFGAASSWDNGVPTGGITAVFDGQGSQVSATSNLDRGTAQFVLKTTPQYHGDIGSAANPLKWERSLRTTIRGTGRVYASPTEPVPASLDYWIVDSKNLIDALTITDSTAINLVFIKSGRVVYLDAGKTTYLVGPQAAAKFDARNVNVPTIYLYDGLVESLADVGNQTIYIFGGRFVQEDGTVDTQSSWQVGPLGVLEIGPGVTAQGTVRLAGTLDLSRSTKDTNFGTLFNLKGSIIGGSAGPTTITVDLNEEYP